MTGRAQESHNPVKAAEGDHSPDRRPRPTCSEQGWTHSRSTATGAATGGSRGALPPAKPDRPDRSSPTDERATTVRGARAHQRFREAEPAPDLRGRRGPDQRRYAAEQHRRAAADHEKTTPDRLKRVSASARRQPRPDTARVSAELTCWSIMSMPLRGQPTADAMRTVGARLRKGRKLRRMTQTKLAKLIGTSPNQISMIENGAVRNITPDDGSGSQRAERLARLPRGPHRGRQAIPTATCST